MEASILVVEDKALLAQDLLDRLDHLGFRNVIGPYSNAEEALVACSKSMPDIALLDITLQGKMSGVELANALNKMAPVPVIYLTHHQDNRVLDEALPTKPIAFINKPYTNNELKMALVNAVEQAKATRNNGTRPEQDSLDNVILDDRIFVRNGRGKISIFVDDILWVQSGGGESSMLVTDELLKRGEGHYPVIGYHLSKLESRLGFYPYLVRCSRYHIVNLKKVQRILDDKEGKSSAKKSLLVAGEEIPVGDKYRKEVMARLRIF